MEKLDNQHYVVIGATTFFVFLLSMIARCDMPDYQKDHVGIANSFVVAGAWLDFIGDLTWTHQRLHSASFDLSALLDPDHAIYNRHEEMEFIFGMCSLSIVAFSTIMIAYKVWTAVLLKHRDELVPEKVTSMMFITLVFISWTDPESIAFFPWKEHAYTGMNRYALPNKDCIRVTLYKLIEDIPEFFLHVAYFLVVDRDTFTAVNLSFTLIMLFYFVMGKLLRIFLVVTPIQRFDQKHNDDPPLGTSF